jgi:hypothetical protein
MPRSVSKKTAELRLAIRHHADAHPDASNSELSAKFSVGPYDIAKALERTADQWQAIVDGTTPIPAARPRASSPPSPSLDSGFETAVVKFRRKPAKMGADFIFWIPRTYIRNGLVDPNVEYEVYLKRAPPKQENPPNASTEPEVELPEIE